MKRSFLVLLLAVGVSQARSNEVIFHEPFAGQLQPGWTWVRENPAGWRIGTNGLEIRVEPGNLWGPANNARNVLVRDLPANPRPLELTATVANQPTEQYEQVNLVCYYDDGHMVKIGLEQVDGRRTIVMGREENDRTRTLAIVPEEASKVDLRLVLETSRIRGYYRPTGTAAWREAGECEPPARSTAKLSLQCYQGPAQTARWASITNVTVRALQP